VALSSSADGTKIAAASFKQDDGSPGSLALSGMLETDRCTFDDGKDLLLLQHLEYPLLRHVLYEKLPLVPSDDNTGDAGETWTEQTLVPRAYWAATALSDDGIQIMAAQLKSGNGSVNGMIWRTCDGGATWTPLLSAGKARWTALGLSGDGSKAVAAGSGLVKLSLDHGMSWAEQSPVSGSATAVWGGVSFLGQKSEIIAAQLLDTNSFRLQPIYIATVQPRYSKPYNLVETLPDCYNRPSSTNGTRYCPALLNGTSFTDAYMVGRNVGARCHRHLD